MYGGYQRSRLGQALRWNTERDRSTNQPITNMQITQPWFVRGVMVKTESPIIGDWDGKSSEQTGRGLILYSTNI